jgi:nucleotide sugar dehydrogenase
MPAEANKLGEKSIKGFSNVMIVGAGTVGSAIGEVISRRDFKVIYCDTNPEVVAKLENLGKITGSIVDYAEAVDLYFICVPTELSKNGVFNLKPLRLSLHTIFEATRNLKVLPFITISSTLLPGTIQDLVADLEQDFPSHLIIQNICYSPEFLRAEYATRDFEVPRLRVISSPSERTRLSMKNFFKEFEGEIVEIESFKEAEFLKLGHNFVNAVEISIWNQLAVIARHLGLNNLLGLKKLIEITAEGRYNKNYAYASLKPISGKCLPKDMKALYQYGKSEELETGFIAGLLEFNSQLERRVGDDNPE